MEKVVEIRYKLAVKRALKGSTTGLDMISIVRYQMPECDLTNVHNATMMVLYQAAFN